MLFSRRPRQPRQTDPGRPQPRQTGPVVRSQSDLVEANRRRIDALTRLQFGTASWAQLRRRNVSKSAITRAVASGRLHEVHPGVYSVVPVDLMGVEAWHAAAILAGGPGACLCAHSAGWWASVLSERPPKIHVAVGSALKELDGVRWHRLGLGEDERDSHRRMPITALARIPLDLARHLTTWQLKAVLAELEYHHEIGPEVVRSTLRRGYPGSAKLRRAIEQHTPQLAQTRSHLEQAFAAFLVDYGFALPEFNHPVGKSTVDALYRDQGVAIELDGVRGHSEERRILRDHQRDLHRRADGLLPIRYHYAQIARPNERLLIVAELDRLGIPRNRVIGVPVLPDLVRTGS